MFIRFFQKLFFLASLFFLNFTQCKDIFVDLAHTLDAIAVKETSQEKPDVNPGMGKGVPEYFAKALQKRRGYIEDDEDDEDEDIEEKESGKTKDKPTSKPIADPTSKPIEGKKTKEPTKGITFEIKPGLQVSAVSKELSEKFEVGDEGDEDEDED